MITFLDFFDAIVFFNIIGSSLDFDFESALTNNPKYLLKSKHVDHQANGILVPKIQS